MPKTPTSRRWPSRRRRSSPLRPPRERTPSRPCTTRRSSGPRRCSSSFPSIRRSSSSATAWRPSTTASMTSSGLLKEWEGIPSSERSGEARGRAVPDGRLHSPPGAGRRRRRRPRHPASSTSSSSRRAISSSSSSAGPRTSTRPTPCSSSAICQQRAAPELPAPQPAGKGRRFSQAASRPPIDGCSPRSYVSQSPGRQRDARFEAGQGDGHCKGDVGGAPLTS